MIERFDVNMVIIYKIMLVKVLNFMADLKMSSRDDSIGDKTNQYQKYTLDEL